MVTVKLTLLALLWSASLLIPMTANAQSDPLSPADPNARKVLDAEKRRVITADRFPADAGPSCDVLILGGGTGGVAAAEAALRRGSSVILVEPTRMLGGQFTSQAVPVPDENSHIEKEPGPSTRTYRALREQVRAHYAATPGILPGREKNVGQCWVSRVSGTPAVWEEAIQNRLRPYQNAQLRTIYLRHTVRGIARYPGNGQISYVDIADLDTGRVTRIFPRYVLDATEDGNALNLAGCPTTVGQEAKTAFQEEHAPDTEQPQWIQSFTYCFALRWQTNSPFILVEKPAEYDYFKSLGEYTLDYVYSEVGTVTYKVLVPTTVTIAGKERRYLPFWTYRRLIASDSFAGNKSPAFDLALMNWRGNDFHEEPYLTQPTPEEQARVLERGRAFAQGFVYWLQNECPRDDGSGLGYPEMQLDLAAVGSDDGLALHPYIRESHRLKAQFTLTENAMLATPDKPDARWGTDFFDTVGCGLYAIDIHPTKDEPHLLATAVLPYHLPLGSFLTESGPTNILPAAKNIGATRLAAASTRMHPTEWLIGEVSGELAAFCIERDVAPAEVRNTPELRTTFQKRLVESGITLHWSEILPPTP